MYDLKIVVYGTLREGCKFHYILPNKDHIISVTTEKIYGFRMYDLGSFPCVERSNNSYIIGEVYHFRFESEYDYNNLLESLDTLERIIINDNLENVGLYRHDIAKTSIGDAIIYVINNYELKHSKKEIIDWVNRE